MLFVLHEQILETHKRAKKEKKEKEAPPLVLWLPLLVASG